MQTVELPNKDCQFHLTSSLIFLLTVSWTESVPTKMATTSCVSKELNRNLWVKSHKGLTSYGLWCCPVVTGQSHWVTELWVFAQEDTVSLEPIDRFGFWIRKIDTWFCEWTSRGSGIGAVICEPESWFLISESICKSVLGQDVEPHTSPNVFIGMWLSVWQKSV